MALSRREFLAAAPMWRAAASAAEPDPRPPLNILLILADDLGAGELGCYGNARHRTPNLDQMAQSGLRFETCYATPLCSPSRVELMTGRYGFRTGFTNFIGRVTTRKERLSADEYTFADLVKTRGYRTGLAGKWQLGIVSQHATMIHDSGFDEYFSWAWKEGGLPKDHTYPGDPHNRYWHPAIVENGKHFVTRPEQHGEDLFSDWIISFMRRNTRFFAYYPMCLVHEPWLDTPDPSKPGARVPGSLQSNVEYMDHIVGKVLAAVPSNTIVIFTGDNGTGKNGKATVTELGVRVPLIVWGPGVPKGRVCRDLVDFSDFFPTLGELAGAGGRVGQSLDGRSFAPQLRGEKGNPREWIFSYLAYERMLRDRRWLLEGSGRMFDCGESRNGRNYREVTGSADPEVLAARARFDRLLRDLPAPPAEAPVKTP